MQIHLYIFYLIKDDKAEIVRYEDEESVISSIAESYIGLNI